MLTSHTQVAHTPKTETSNTPKHSVENATWYQPMAPRLKRLSVSFLLAFYFAFYYSPQGL